MAPVLMSLAGGGSSHTPRTVRTVTSIFLWVSKQQRWSVHSWDSGGSDWHLLAGLLVEVAAYAHLWNPGWHWWLAPTPGAHVDGVLLPESEHRERGSYGGPTPTPLPCTPNGALPLWWAPASSECTLSCHIPASSGCVRTANCGPLPGLSSKA